MIESSTCVPSSRLEIVHSEKETRSPYRAVSASQKPALSMESSARPSLCAIPMVTGGSSSPADSTGVGSTSSFLPQAMARQAHNDILKNNVRIFFLMKKILMPIAVKVKDLIFPPRCPGCDKVLSYEEKGFCKKCMPKVRRIQAPVCSICGKSVEPARDGEAALCSDCQKRKHYFDGGRAIYEYSGPMKTAMYRFKYSNRRCYVDTFSADVQELLGAWIKKINPQVIVPVPMYAKKKRLRGYNQAEVLGKSISEKLNIPFDNSIVKRVADTTPMKELSRENRRENLKNAFILSRSDVKFRCVLIVDDIYTTGATVDAVARALREAGVSCVYALYACIGKGE